MLRTLGSATTSNINLTGNEVGQQVFGNAGSNVINGGAGNDTLFGNGGADFFLFNTALSAATNLDTVSDYNVAADTIRIDNAVFTGLATGTLAAGAFRIGAAAADADDRIIYNSGNGNLIFDPNGNAAGGAVVFADLASGLAMTNAEFVVV
jgi:Ca2+-binding RTX toxin-like protein